MRILITLLLLAAPAYAQGYDEYGNDHLKGIRGTLNMGQAYQWGRLQNQLAAEAPPERKQIEIINRNPAAYSKDTIPLMNSDMLSNMFKALEKENAAKVKDSPFNDSFMPE